MRKNTRCCPRCGTLAAWQASFCVRCGVALHGPGRFLGPLPLVLAGAFIVLFGQVLETVTAVVLPVCVEVCGPTLWALEIPVTVLSVVFAFVGGAAATGKRAALRGRLVAALAVAAIVTPGVLVTDLAGAPVAGAWGPAGVVAASVAGAALGIPLFGFFRRRAPFSWIDKVVSSSPSLTQYAVVMTVAVFTVVVLAVPVVVTYLVSLMLSSRRPGSVGMPAWAEQQEAS